MPSEYAEDIATIKANTSNIIKSLDALTDTVGDERTEREKLGNRVTRIEERMGIWGAAQAAYATAVAALAGFLGARQ